MLQGEEQLERQAFMTSTTPARCTRPARSTTSAMACSTRRKAPRHLHDELRPSAKETAPSTGSEA